MSKKLSLIIPTLNRVDYLKITIENLIPQIQRNLSVVQFVVCCNASKDGTDDYMKTIVNDYPFVEYYYFDEYMEIGDSIIRSANKTKGEYTIIWGDDDISYPFFIDYIINTLNKYPGVGMIFCNRLIGRDAKFDIKNLDLYDKNYSKEILKYSLDEFIKIYNESLGFISSIVFRSDSLTTGMNFYSKEHYGYEFISVFAQGALNRVCLSCQFPIIIQRIPFNRDFLIKWPLFHFIGTPNMLLDFEKRGITCNALNHWHETGNSSFKKFIWHLLFTTQDRKFYKPLCSQIAKYQPNILRKIIVYFIIYYFPKSIFYAIRRFIYR